MLPLYHTAMITASLLLRMNSVDEVAQQQQGRDVSHWMGTLPVQAVLASEPVAVQVLVLPEPEPLAEIVG